MFLYNSDYLSEVSETSYRNTNAIDMYLQFNKPVVKMFNFGLKGPRFDSSLGQKIFSTLRGSLKNIHFLKIIYW